MSLCTEPPDVFASGRRGPDLKSIWEQEVIINFVFHFLFFPIFDSPQKGMWKLISPVPYLIGKRIFSCARKPGHVGRPGNAVLQVLIPESQEYLGASLVVQWLRLHAPSAGGCGSIPGQGTRFHMPQLRVCILQLKIPSAATETWCSQINLEEEEEKKSVLLRLHSQIPLQTSAAGSLGKK